MRSAPVFGRREVPDAAELLASQFGDVPLESALEDGREANSLGDCTLAQHKLLCDLPHARVAEPCSACHPLRAVGFVTLSKFDIREERLSAAAPGARQELAWATKQVRQQQRAPCFRTPVGLFNTDDD
jgi:hypothetical protein